MSDIEWQPLPSPMWPDPAVWTDVGDFTLLVFTLHGVPTWEVRRRTKLSSENRNDLAPPTRLMRQRQRHSSRQACSPENEDVVSLNPEGQLVLCPMKCSRPPACRYDPGQCHRP
jgi:hypothetical protein